MRIFIFFMALVLFPVSAVAQTVFFYADAESGTIRPPWNRNDNIQATISESTVYSGKRSYRFHLPDPCPTCGQSKNQSLVVAQKKQVEAYYSAWGYIQEGVTAVGTQFQFKLDINSPGSGVGPKVNLGIFDQGEGRQIYPIIRNCKMTGSAHILVGEMSKNSPCRFQQTKASAVTFPLHTWTHVEVYLRATATNGELKIWQNGMLIYHIAHANLDTLTLPDTDREFLQWHLGLYQSNETGPQTMYWDDAMITDYPVFVPGYRTSSPPAGPTKLIVNRAK